MGMIRKIKRSVMRNQMSGAPAVGNVRAGMHQKSEHEFLHARMAQGAPKPELAEDALNIPEAIEAEIPPEEDDDEIVEEIAEGDAVVAADAEISEEIADPQAEINEETAEEPDVREQEAVDYSEERIPVLEVCAGGVDCEARELIYRSGDSEARPIDFSAVERSGVRPFIPEMINPSANVPAAED